MTDKPNANMQPLLYVYRIHELQTICRACGYVLALHGSMQRDLDAIAAPWSNKAVPAETLVELICDQMDLHVSSSSPTEKPHGRRAWSLLMEDGQGYIDLSIMPRIEPVPVSDQIKEEIEG